MGFAAYTYIMLYVEPWEYVSVHWLHGNANYEEIALVRNFESMTSESQTPFATRSSGQRANHSAMTHPLKNGLATAERH